MSGQIPSGSSACCARLEQFERDRHGQFVGRDVVLQARFPFALLDERAIPPDADENLLLPLGLADCHAAYVAGIDLIDFAFKLRFQAGAGGRIRVAVAEIEAVQIIDLLAFAAADRVEIVFHLGREFVIDESRQMIFQKLRHGERVQVGTSAVPRLTTYSRARIVSMIEAYVLGRPMPISSSERVSVASVNRAGGCVVWLLGSSSRQASDSSTRDGRQHGVALR